MVYEKKLKINTEVYTPEQAREVLAEYDHLIDDDSFEIAPGALLDTYQVNPLQRCLSKYGEQLESNEIEKIKTLLENYKAWEKWD